MSKDSFLNISSRKRNKRIFPARISSKVPIKLSSHSRNNSFERQLYKSENNHKNDISIAETSVINSKNIKEESQSSSYYSFFSSEKEPSNTSNSSFEYNESVTMAVLNLDCYSKLNNSSKESSDFDSDTLNKILDNDKEFSKSYTLDSHVNEGEMIFSPDESPINILEKPSYDTSKSILFSNSNTSNDNSSDKRKITLKKSRNGSHGRKPSKGDDHPIFNSEIYSDIRSSSLPRKNMDIHSLNNRTRSSTLPSSKINNNTYNIEDIEPVNPINYERKNNYNLYNDDNDSFVYNQSEINTSYSKYKNNDIPDSNEERRYRSLSRRHEHNRSVSKNSENDRSEGKGRSRSRSKSKSKVERQNSQSESRYRSLSRNRKNSKDDEGRFHSLSRSRKNSKDDNSEYRSLSRSRKDSRDDERVEKERKRSTSRHKKCHKRNKSSSNHSSPIVKSSPLIRNNNHGSPLVSGSSLSRKNSHESNIESPLVRGSSLARKNSHESNIGSPLVRNNSRGGNNGSPLVRKENHRSPLASNSVINNKFSTDYIYNDYNKSPYDSKKYQNIETPYKKNNDYHDDHRNNNPLIKTVGETQNLDIINEICDLKKFSQDFSGLNVLESILNKPIEDDFEFLNYNKIPEKKLNDKKFSTLSRLQTKNNKSHELTRRNSDNDFSKRHNRTKSEQTRNEDNHHKGSKRNFFNFFSHKKSKSYSNSSDKEESDFDKMIKGNETIKIKLQPTNKFGLSYMERSKEDYNNDSYYDSGIHNEEYKSNYNNILNEKMMNQQQNSYNQTMNYAKNYTPLFRVSLFNKNKNHHYNNMEFYGANTEIATNPYDQFNSFSTDGSDRNYINIGNRNSSLNKYNKYGGKRVMY